MSASYSSKVLALELRVVNKLCESIDTPRALSVALLVKYEQWDELLGLTIRAEDYEDHTSFSYDYLVTSILSKNPRLPTGIDKRAVAIAKFHAAEAVCSQANARISEFYSRSRNVDPDIVSVLFRSQVEIQRILGPFPTRKDLDYAEQNMRFGPGATTSVTGIVTQGKKYSPRTVEVTSRLLPFRTHCFPDLWKQYVGEVAIRNSSRMTTVPKNAKTDRVICIEPDLNIFVQLGLGALLRNKLLRSGLDLQTQENNRSLAQRAYKDGLATVDLSSASDTISREAVHLLLPDQWAHLLRLARVDSTELDGVVYPLEKWSSMGNGYTFELETLIFYGVALAVCHNLGLPTDDVISYGDDIIIPEAAFGLLQRTLNYLGFSVNREKSFGKGVFHESCGADYFLGHNVRPVFLRSELHDFESVCYLYANSLRRWANRQLGGLACDSRILPAWLTCFTAVKPAFRLFIPDGFGDSGFVESFDRATPNVRRPPRERGWGGYNFRYRRLNSVQSVISQSGAYLAYLNGTHSEFSYGRETLRGRYRPPSIETGYVLTWPNLGPWV